MTKILKQRSLLFLIILFLSQFAWAQADKPEMADVMRSNGKIYVVVAVCLVILFGLIGYVIRIDWSIRKMEQQKKD